MCRVDNHGRESALVPERVVVVEGYVNYLLQAAVDVGEDILFRPLKMLVLLHMHEQNLLLQCQMYGTPC